MSNDVKFIRKHGRIIPIRIKGNGNVDKRHITNIDMAKYVANKKKKKGILGALTFTFASKEEVANSLKRHGLRGKRNK